MIRLTSRCRDLLVETIRELANLAAGALVLGRFVGQQPFSFALVLGGIAAWFVLVGLALSIAEGKDDG